MREVSEMSLAGDQSGGVRRGHTLFIGTILLNAFYLHHVRMKASVARSFNLLREVSSKLEGEISRFLIVGKCCVW